MKCYILFSEKNKKNISKCRLLKILPRVLSVKEKLRTTSFSNLWFSWQYMGVFYLFASIAYYQPFFVAQTCTPWFHDLLAS